MKKIFFIASILLLLLPLITSAHMNEGQALGQQLLGQNTFETMLAMEDQMMGSNHERMEELVEKMMQGTLISGEQQEMVQLMRDNQIGVAANLMMMRMAMPRMMQNAGLSGLGAGWMMNYGFGPNTSLFVWITLVLIWATLLLAIMGLLRYLKKN